MLYLAIRTDSSEAQVTLIEVSGTIIANHSWDAGRELSKTLLATIQEVLVGNNKKISDVTGLIVFQGPGSFTGLRIGLTVANTFAHTQQIPIVAVQGENWQEVGLEKLQNKEDDKITTPFYGADAHITQPRK